MSTKNIEMTRSALKGAEGVRKMAAFIGGNLADIEASANRLIVSGTAAEATGTDTAAAALALQEAIDTAMSNLVTAFEGVAAALTDDIQQSHGQLVGSDWRGASRENAIAIKETLQGQVNTVLGLATTNLANEQTAFTTRAQDLVAHVEGQFKQVMADVQTQYGELADAASRTKANLEAADQTILA